MQVVAVFKHHVGFWDHELKQRVALIPGKFEESPYVSFAQGGQYAAFGSRSQPGSVFDFQKKKTIESQTHGRFTRSAGAEHEPERVAVSDKFIARTEHGDTIWTLNFASRESDKLRAGDPKRPGQVTAMAFSPNGEFLAAGHVDDNGRTTLEVTYVEDDGRVALRGHVGPIRHLLFAGDKTIISAADDGTIRIWDVAVPRRVLLPRNQAGVNPKGKK